MLKSLKKTHCVPSLFQRTLSYEDYNFLRSEGFEADVFTPSNWNTDRFLEEHEPFNGAVPALHLNTTLGATYDIYVTPLCIVVLEKGERNAYYEFFIHGYIDFECAWNEMFGYIQLG